MLLAGALLAVFAAGGVFAYSRAGAGSSEPLAGAAAATAVATPSPVVIGSPTDDARIIAAGDIGRCDSKADDKTGQLVSTLPGTVLLLGDDAYNNGTAKEFTGCYAPSWGPLLFRTWASPGNHDHYTVGATPYFDYFGSRAGPDRRGWYSVELGAWHVVSLDSECLLVGGCGPESDQGRWLTADLVAHPTSCVLAFWHRPRFSSGVHGDDPGEDGLWRAVVAGGVDVILNGHDHDYERLDPLSADGAPDPSGVREFVVGTGGAPLRDFPQSIGRSAFRDAKHHGVITMTLTPTGYDWAFLRTPNGAVVDSGSSPCQNTRSAIAVTATP